MLVRRCSAWRFSALVAVAIGLLLVGGCASERVNAPESGSPPKTNPTEQGADTGPILVYRQKQARVNWSDKQGRRRMSASAREIGWNEASLKGQALDFSAQLYENGKLTASIKAPKAVVDTKTQTVTATGGVVMESLERKTTVHAEWMKWYAEKHKVVGNGGVKIESPQWKAEGAAIEADTSLENYRILDSAKGLEIR
ncbi:MAG: LPS export ABC transporter periplasmic protein LptC [Armatimonadetes bacterium RBG_16_58_9]|nr:MAG: LPS export ABC transporter periplasmic protein LptC [Armatimonadetes bacterium RBG_16_58_9]